MVEKGTNMIRHTVAFKLKHPPNSKAERDFLTIGKHLADIPGVNNFECLRQISPKNSFSFGFSMEFNSHEAYQAYNDHPEHIAFVQNRWIPEVEEFLEIDYEPCERV